MGKVLTSLIDEANYAAGRASATYHRLVDHNGNIQKLRDQAAVLDKQKSKKIEKLFAEEAEKISSDFVKLNQQFHEDKANFGTQVSDLQKAIANLHAHVLHREKKNKWLKKESTEQARQLVKDLNETYKDLYQKVKKVG